MNIAHLVFSFQNGGIENMLVDVLNYWDLNDCIYLYIINENYDDELISKIKTSQNIKIIKLNRKPKGNKIKYIKKLRKSLIVNKIDVIHCHNSRTFEFLLPIKIFYPRLKVFMTIHDTNKYKYYSILKRIMHKIFIKKIICISNAVREECLNSGVKASKLEIVYNGISTEKFCFQKEKHDKKIILNVARIIPEKKGQDILLKAGFELKKIRNDFEIWFVGSGNEKDLLSMEKLVDSLELNENVKFLGNRNDVPDLLQKADLFVLSSRYEGFGIALIEAMMSKVPIISSNIDGPREILSNFSNCLFENENYMQLASLINYKLDKVNLLEIDEAYEFAIHNFSIEKMIKELTRIYTK